VKTRFKRLRVGKDGRHAPAEPGPLDSIKLGFKTILMHSSCLSRNILKPRGASSRGSL
jgi:hypothetical protein